MNIHRKIKAGKKWLNEEYDQKAVYLEEKYEQYKERLVTGDEELFFYMGRIYKFGNRYTVTEESHYYMCQIAAAAGRCSEVMKQLPEKMAKNNSPLYICEKCLRFHE